MPPTTQDIEAGLAPAGIGPPAAPPPPPDPLRLGALPAQQPSLQVVDRQEYLRQQQAAAQARQQILDMAARAQRAAQPLYDTVAAAPTHSRPNLPPNPSLVPPPGATLDPAQQDQVRRFGRLLTPTEEIEQHYRTARDPFMELGKGALDVATTEIPGAQQVANVAGDIGQRAAQAGAQVAMGPLAPLERFSPVKPSAVAGAVGGTIAESLVPTEVWQAALELVPGVGTAPELIRIAREGGAEWASAAAKLAKTEDGQRVLRALGSEAGFAQLGPKEIKGVTQAEIEKAGIQRALDQKALEEKLTRGERNRLRGGTIKDVITIAERYPAGSEQRAALIKAAEPAIAGLPEVNQKFIRASLDTLPARAERSVATDVQRARQAAMGNEAFTSGGGSTVERAVAGFKALGGKQVQRFTPIGDQFTPEEVSSLYDQIDQAVASKKIGIFDGLNATSGLNLLLTGKRLEGVGSEEAKALNLAPHEIKRLGRIFGPEFEAAIPKSAAHMSNWEKFFDVMNLPRALVTALDFSAAGRQGILLAARNPVEWGKSIKPMIKAMGSEEGLSKVGQNIISNPRYEDGVIHGLVMTDIGGGAQGEEAFVSHIAARLPFVRGSERGYVAFLDNLRMLTYEKYANRMESYAEHKGWDLARTDAVKEQIAKFLNHATGRGDLGGLNKFTPALNAVFFAPRYFASRPQSIWDMVRPGADKFTRQVAFENLGAFVGAGMAALGAAKLAGADVEMNPISSDFGRIKIGPTRIDFWGGYQPIARYIAQIGSGHVKSTGTGITSFANPGETATRFFRSKLSPLGAAIYDYGPGKQKDYAGNDLIIPIKDLAAGNVAGIPGSNKDTGALAWNTFATKVLPLSLQDAIQGYQAAGGGWQPTPGKLAHGAAAAGVSTLGGGVSSYEPTEKQQKTAEKASGQGDLKDAGVPYAGNRIDFRQPILDAKPEGGNGLTTRQLIAKSLGIKDVADDASLAEMRSAYIAEGKTPLERKDLGDKFDTFPPVVDVGNSATQSADAWWASHPDKLKQAIDSGAIPQNEISDAKIQILKDAGLLP